MLLLTEACGFMSDVNKRTRSVPFICHWNNSEELSDIYSADRNFENDNDISKNQLIPHIWKRWRKSKYTRVASEASEGCNSVFVSIQVTLNHTVCSTHLCQNTPHLLGFYFLILSIISDKRQQEMWNMKQQWGWKPADAQDDGIQMGACVKCLHVANSHLPVNPEPREMFNSLLMMEEKGRNEWDGGRREWGDKNC